MRDMQCPYCDEVVADFDDFNMHVLKNHPDKISLEDFKEAKRDRLWGTATSLTAISLGTKVTDKDKVLSTFKFFLKSLMESGL
jgi:hypothetical protein